MIEKTLTTPDQLRAFTGSDFVYRHRLVRKIVYTEGVSYVAMAGGAYWLLDELAFSQVNPAIAVEDFQVWRLRVAADRTATLTCGDGNDRVVFTKHLDFTDFPLDEICLSRIRPFSVEQAHGIIVNSTPPAPQSTPPWRS